MAKITDDKLDTLMQDIEPIFRERAIDIKDLMMKSLHKHLDGERYIDLALKQVRSILRTLEGEPSSQEISLLLTIAGHSSVLGAMLGIVESMREYHEELVANDSYKNDIEKTFARFDQVTGNS